MNLAASFDKAVSILRLDPVTIKTVAEDSNALRPGLVLTVIAGALSGLPSGLRDAALGMIVTPIAVCLTVGIAFVLAKLFKGSGTYMSLLRPYLHAFILTAPLSLCALIPIRIVALLLGVLGSLYLLLVFVIIIEETQRIGRGAAVAVVLLPVVPPLMLASLIVLTQGQGIAPFIYALF